MIQVVAAHQILVRLALAAVQGDDQARYGFEQLARPVQGRQLQFLVRHQPFAGGRSRAEQPQALGGDGDGFERILCAPLGCEQRCRVRAPACDSEQQGGCQRARRGGCAHSISPRLALQHLDPGCGHAYDVFRNALTRTSCHHRAAQTHRASRVAQTNALWHRWRTRYATVAPSPSAADTGDRLGAGGHAAARLRSARVHAGERHALGAGNLSGGPSHADACASSAPPWGPAVC